MEEEDDMETEKYLEWDSVKKLEVEKKEKEKKLKEAKEKEERERMKSLKSSISFYKSNPLRIIFEIDNPNPVDLYICRYNTPWFRVCADFSIKESDTGKELEFNPRIKVRVGSLSIPSAWMKVPKNGTCEAVTKLPDSFSDLVNLAGKKKVKVKFKGKTFAFLFPVAMEDLIARYKGAKQIECLSSDEIECKA